MIISDWYLKRGPRMTDINTAIAGKLRVLIVDDDLAIRELYRTYLSRNGFICDTVPSGRDALLVLMKQNFDVLIVDLRMEHMDGLVFLQEALKIWPWLEVVISSGYVTPEIISQAEEMGIHRIHKKSETMSALVENVTAAASERRINDNKTGEDNALRLMRAHMSIMTRLTRSHAEIDVLVTELAQFGYMLSDMLGADLSGILVYEEDNKNLILTGRSLVTSEFTAQVADEMISRFNVLSGRALSRDAVTVRYEGSSPVEDGLTKAGKIVSVPIIMNDDIAGLVTLASAKPDPSSPSDVSLLYHAANHVSSLFMTLQEIHSMAARDTLTGVYNRMRLDDELKRAWDLSKRYGSDVGIIMLDIDHFKRINDTFGHATGDEVLKEFGGILKSAARGSDIIARFGGDEFVLILPRVEEQNASVLAQRILERTQKHMFCPDSLKLSLTTSIGIAGAAHYPPPESAAILMKRADEALYEAKRSGRNQICIWNKQPAPKADTQPSSASEEDTLPAQN